MFPKHKFCITNSVRVLDGKKVEKTCPKPTVKQEIFVCRNISRFLLKSRDSRKFPVVKISCFTVFYPGRFFSVFTMVFSAPWKKPTNTNYKCMRYRISLDMCGNVYRCKGCNLGSVHYLREGGGKNQGGGAHMHLCLRFGWPFSPSLIKH